MTKYVAWGFDYAFGDGITVAELEKAGCEFVCRYLSGTPGSGKNISAQEILNYYRAGINVVFNWETTGLETNRAQGISEARGAQAELDRLAAELVALKAPPALVAAVKVAPVIFSLDTAPTGNVIPGAEEYQNGVVSVLGIKRSGGYGGYEWINTAFDLKLITYGWQTYAWSDNEWAPRAQLQQWHNGYIEGPAQVDQDRTTTSDYGQCMWHAPAPPAPKPAPAPKPPKPVRHVADGTMTLDQFLAKGKYSSVETIETSAAKLMWFNLRKFTDYLASGPASVMPKGLVFWTAR